MPISVADFIQHCWHQGAVSPVSAVYKEYKDRGGELSMRQLSVELKAAGIQQVMAGKPKYRAWKNLRVIDLERAIELFDLKFPVTFVSALGWRDGGTMGYIFEDIENKKFEFCLEGRTGHAGINKDIYIGSNYPIHGNPELLVKGDIRARALLLILKAMIKLNAYPDYAQLDRLVPALENLC